MVSARDQFDAPVPAEKLFENTIRSQNTGTRLSIRDSVERIIGEMEMNLDEMREDGTWNGGMRIKDGQRQEIYQVIAKPLLLAAQDVAHAVSRSRGYRNDFEVEFSASGRTESLNLYQLGDRVIEGFNTWLAQVASDDHPEMSDPALPLAINDVARVEPDTGITRLTDILQQVSNEVGWQPKAFVTNGQSSEIMAKNSGDSLPNSPFLRNPS